MKMINPFKRLDKKEFIPLSLFPASKVTKTSLELGRATPIYYNEMIQGNKISLDVSELCRFGSLDVPTMNEFEVGIAAYFVPYVSFDEYFTNPAIRKYAASNSAFAKDLATYQLNARNFFNPAMDDSLRVHPISLKGSFLSGTQLIGGLMDHLGYYLGQNEKLSEVNGSWYLIDGGYQGTITGTQITNLITDIADPVHSFIKNRDRFFAFSSDSALSLDDVPVVQPVDVYFMNKYVDPRFTGYTITATDIIDTYTSSYYESHKAEVDSIVYYILGGSEPSNLIEWSSLFGKNTQSSLIRDYYNYLESSLKFIGAKNFELNVVKALAYYRIYADWFLEDNFIKRDDFLGLVGDAYIRSASGLATTLREAFEGSNVIGYSNSASIFRDDLCTGRCLPVPAEKNYFTAARGSETLNIFDDFKYNGNGAAETPVGQTIHEHFFNRAYQRFKDFITRLGYDFRDNAAGLYGHRTSDESLLRSQIFGSTTMDVKIGDIAQTSSSDSNGALGSLAGIAMSKGGSDKWTFTANENGCVMILAWLRPKSTAIAGTIDRCMFKSNYHDYLNPMFGGVGMQDISFNEIFPKGDNSDTRFGITEIYSEYMSVNNECSGLMRTSMSKWNEDRILDHKPSALDAYDGAKLLYLNNDWHDDMNRIFNDTETAPILSVFYITGNVTRQLPETLRTDF